MFESSYLDREPIMRNRLKYDPVNGRLRISMHVGTFRKSSLDKYGLNEKKNKKKKKG